MVHCNSTVRYGTGTDYLLDRSSLLSFPVRDPVLSPYRPQDRSDRKMRNSKIGHTETRVQW
jgi:hypothetical protein